MVRALAVALTATSKRPMGRQPPLAVAVLWRWVFIWSRQCSPSMRVISTGPIQLYL
jgi:hypothetical protein